MPDDRLEHDLVELGRHFDVPAPPDVAFSVRQTLAAQLSPPVAVPTRRNRWPRLAQAAAAIGVVLGGALVVSPQVRAAVGDVLEFAGIELREEPAPVPIPPVASPLPGQQSVSLDDAREAVAFDVYVPEALGEPDAATLVEDRIVSLLYEARPDRPAILIDEFHGLISPMFQKYVDADAEPVRIGPYPGFWIAEPHELLYIDRNGVPREEAVRMAGKTLIWQIGDTTLRMEGDFTREEALAIAGSISP